jgi:Asp-tRNA(Asn)/Glu-tRNA(Gln) amidotransferase A subunit family amidase
MSPTPSQPFGQRLSPCSTASQGPHEDIATLSVIDIAAQIRRRELSCIEVAQAYMERIQTFDGRDGLNAYLSVDPELALARARKLDRILSTDQALGALHGVPLAIKDAIDTVDLGTTGGTKVLKNWQPGADAAVVKQLRDAGALVLGKTNLHEASFGITSNNPHYGAVHNPYARERIPGAQVAVPAPL